MHRERPSYHLMPLEKTVIDFFAGIGLASVAFESQQWKVKYALDHSKLKQRMYEDHFGSGHYHPDDIKHIDGRSLPKVTLAHASFPCTDTSLAGSRGGIDTGESSMFWEFIRILSEMEAPAGPGKPAFVLVENVEGLISSGGGQDLASILDALNGQGYATDLLRIDAAHFVPQSRVRLFIIGGLGLVAQDKTEIESRLINSSDTRGLRIRSFIRKHDKISWHLRDMPDLPKRKAGLEKVIDQTAEWWPKERTEYLLSQMFDRHKHELQRLMRLDCWSYRTVFRRMRVRDGASRSTAEMRTDGIAGCLRTPKGGSARQIVIRAGRGQVDARLLNARENARLMGADDFVINPKLKLNDALFGFGDAVCVPVIEWIIKNYLDALNAEYPRLVREIPQVVAA